jgi:molecular chaperone DnaJ
MQKDYYAILGIDRNASQEDIKKAFHKLAHKYHPDKKGGDEAKFKEIGEAYGVLGDEKKRHEYDAYGRVFSGSGQGQGFGGFDFGGFDTNGQGFEFDINDIFGEFFGGGMRRRARRGRDISIDLEIPFREAIFGTKRTVLLAKVGICTSCEGSGAKPGSEMVSCEACGGNGRVHETKSSFLGTFSSVRTCDACNGRGQLPKEVCQECGGRGSRKREEEITISIPAGINDGEMIRLAGAGEGLVGGAAGDLYVKIHVKSDPLFRREGANIVMDLNVKLTDAMLGSSYTVETLDGPLTVKVPASVSHNEILRVRNRGVPTSGGRRGDLLIRVKITLPKKLSKKAKDAVEKLREEGI